MLASSVPAFAQESRAPKPRRSTATIVKWVAIGVAAGTGLGFMMGWKAYEKAPFAERKIYGATAAGALVGAAAGLAMGLHRSAPKASSTSVVQPQVSTSSAYPTSLAEAARPHPLRPPVR